MAFLDKLNKLAKELEEKTGDAMEISRLNAIVGTEEQNFEEAIYKIGEFYYEFYLAGGRLEPNIRAVAAAAKEHTENAARAKADIERINAENEAERAAAKEAAKAEREAARAEKAAAKAARLERDAQRMAEAAREEAPAPEELPPVEEV